MASAPREIVTPYRPIPLEVPEGMKPNEFFNSAENLADLVKRNAISPAEIAAFARRMRVCLDMNSA